MIFKSWYVENLPATNAAGIIWDVQDSTGADIQFYELFKKNMKLLPLFIRTRILSHYMFCLTLCFGTLICYSQGTEQKLPIQEKGVRTHDDTQNGCVIQSVETSEKPYAGYVFYNEQGEKVKATNIRFFPNDNPFHDPAFLKTFQSFAETVEDKQEDTLNALIKYNLRRMPSAKKNSFFSKKTIQEIPEKILNTSSAIVSNPNTTWLSGSKHQFLIVKSNADFITGDSTIWQQTYVSIYNCNGIVQHQLTLNYDVNKIEISDDGRFLLSELITRYYGEEEIFVHRGILITDLSTRQNKILKTNFDQDATVSRIEYSNGYFEVFFNKDFPIDSVDITIISPAEKKIYQKRMALKDLNEWAPLKLADGSSIDLKTFRVSDF